MRFDPLYSHFFGPTTHHNTTSTDMYVNHREGGARVVSFLKTVIGANIMHFKITTMPLTIHLDSSELRDKEGRAKGILILKFLSDSNGEVGNKHFIMQAIL